MGLDDREYMREVPIYRRLTGRSEGGQGKVPDDGGHDVVGAGEQPLIHRLTYRDYVAPKPRRVRRARRRRTPAWQWLAVLAGAVGMFFVLVYRAEHKKPNPGTAALARVPAPAVRVEASGLKTAHVGLIRGTRLLQFGSRFTLSGTTPPVSGTVRVLGRWNAGHWRTLAVANANGRPFSFSFPLGHRGTLRIKIVQPDGYTSVGT